MEHIDRDVIRRDGRPDEDHSVPGPRIGLRRKIARLLDPNKRERRLVMPWAGKLTWA
jgi:hypothetical protein